MATQVGLLAAGCQPWHMDVCAASGDRFAYSATLAIYIYELDREFHEFKLVSIMSEHKKTVTAITWSLKNTNVFASASTENKIIIWDVSLQKPLSILEDTKVLPLFIGWCLHEEEAVTYISGKGPLFLWRCLDGSSLTHVKGVSGFSSEVSRLRWHPKKMQKLVLGHADGSISVCNIGSKMHKHVLQPEVVAVDPITALEWDPLSLDYLLVSNLEYGIRLVDTESLSVIMKFTLPSAAARVRAFSWVTSAPGMFVTGDAQSGVLRLWNVSKSTPVENIKMKKTGFHTLQVICNTNNPYNHNGNAKNNPVETKVISSTSMAQNPTGITTSCYALPPARVVCTFLDGGVGLYDLGRRKWDFLRDQGHIETIFDCHFKPDSCDLLATASFDGTIRVWDINTLTAKYTSPGNQGIIYSLSWAPGDLNCIVGSTSKNGYFIWDIEKGKVIKRFKQHGISPVYSVAWNQKDSRRIMSCSGDGYCLIQQPDGEIIQKYHHPGSVFGCDWSPHNKDMLATGCEDKCVRVYYLTTNSDQPLKVFSGHTSKVFHIRWSPLREGILCSGSDDCTIRIWDYTQDTCINVLRGHEGPVRGLIWNSELPYILISGSWDRSIRIWDIRDGACIDEVMDHGADVYGLACHPSRPFLLASSSRDSTVRLWSITSLAMPVELNILVGKPWSDIIGSVESAMSLGTQPFLTGKVSKELKIMAEDVPDTRSKTLQAFSEFLSPPNGTRNLWDLVSVVQGKDTTVLSASYGSGIVHVKHLARFKASQAQELEMIKMSKFGGGIGAPTREECLREAANIHIKLGNIQRYCELMVELGEWEKALSVAPGVSQSYWTSLSRRYAQYLIQEDSDKAIPYCTTTGDAKILADFLIHRGQISDAVLVAQVACEECYPRSTLEEAVQKSTLWNGVDANDEEIQRLLDDTTKKLAEWYFHGGSPTMAACCHLAVGDCQTAISKLIRGHELELAAAMGIVLGNVPAQTKLALQLLSRRCEYLGRWELAIELLKLAPGNDLAMAKCCARCAASMDEINFIHQMAGIPTVDECFAEAEKLRTKVDLFQCVKVYLLSHSPEVGLELGLADIKSKLRNPNWQTDDVFRMLELIASIRSDRLQLHKCQKMKCELLTLSAFVGALIAIRRQYHSIVPALFSHTRTTMTKHALDMPFTEEDILRWSNAWLTVHKMQKQSSPSFSKDAVPSDILSTYEELLTRAGIETSATGVGPDRVISSHLPSHSDIHTSCLTGNRVKGLAHFLEDGRSAMSINEALMWAKVNPFSPLGSGLRINPF